MKTKSFPISISRGSATVTIYRTPTRGRESYTLSYWFAGKRERPSFADLEEAKREAAAIATRMTTGDLDVLTLKSEDRSAYVTARALIEPTGVSLSIAAAQFAEAWKLSGGNLVEAARDYAKRRHEIVATKTVAEVVDEMMEAKKLQGLSRRYLVQLRYDVKRFAAAFQTSSIASVSAAGIDAWLNSLKVSARTRNNFRTSLQTLFSFAKGRRYLGRDFDEVSAVPLAKLPAAGIDIFSPHEMSRMLAHAPAEIIPFVAIGAFAGIRHAEILRLDWRDVKFDQGFVEVRAGNSKTASRRLVPIADNLRAWLMPHASPAGPVCRYKNMSAELVWLSKLSGVAWKKNGLRHSYISYRIAETQNVNQVALEAGNSAGIIFRHYREVVTGPEAKAWFSVAPAPGDKVLLFKTP